VTGAPPIDRVSVDAFKVPTDGPEADGTLEWDSTTLVVVEVAAGGCTGLGFSYTTRAAAPLVHDVLAPLLAQGDPFAVPSHHATMLRSVRNVGRRGIAAGAISAVDTALWDLKAHLLDVPLASLFGQRRPAAPIYGSGGFTSYSDRQTIEQFSGWIEALGCTHVKMKVGAEPERDRERIAAVHAALP
jgi:L-alanine-DL-glutamate epimerase-like enolase superfamily enzyme